MIGSRPSLTVWLKNKGSRAVFFHGAAFHGFLSVYGTHFHKVTNFPAIVFVGKTVAKAVEIRDNKGSLYLKKRLYK